MLRTGLTFEGGYQQYCCTGFVPSSYQNTDSLDLIGRTLAKRQSDTGPTPASQTSCVSQAAVAAVAAVAGSSISQDNDNRELICQIVTVLALSLLNPAFGAFALFSGLDALLAGTVGIAGALGGTARCLSNPNIGAPVGFVSPTFNPATITVQLAPVAPPIINANPVGQNLPPIVQLGQWLKQVYPTTSTTDCTCSVTYTCRYGLGFDEVSLMPRAMLYSLMRNAIGLR
jgi:chitinase